MPKQKTVIYISAPEEARVFKTRCEPHSAVMRVGTFDGLGSPDFFSNLGKALAGTRASYTIFDLPSIAKTIPASTFTDEIKKYIRDGTVKLALFYIIDPDHLYKQEGRDVFQKFGVKVVDRIEEIGDPFSALDSEEKAKIKNAGVDDALFSELDDTAVSDTTVYKPGGIPSLIDVPDSVNKAIIDPFADLDDASIDDENDPFKDFENIEKKLAKQDDPFGGGDLFSDFEDDFGKGNDDFSDDFNDDFADDFADDFNTDFKAGVASNHDEGLPGLTIPTRSGKPSTNASPSLLGSKPQGDNPSRQNAASATIDPFEGLDDHDYSNDPFADLENNNSVADNDYDDEYEDEYDDEFDDNVGHGGRSYMTPSGAIVVEPGPDGYVSIDDILVEFSGMLTAKDMDRLLMMQEPEWDYELANDDIGGGLFGKGKGGKRKGKKLSQVDSSSLVDSAYIAEKNREGGYIRPEETKCILIYSPKGGTGKTSIATMIATQLNWYFNRELMQGGVTQNARILILSLNEFDDISVNDIGGQSFIQQDEAGEGRNVAELVKRIKETGGNPEWDDISHCFTASPSNFVFYLPSMTMKESVLSGIQITAEDYKQIIEICSRFFSFIVLDSPDIFYQEKEGLMSFAFNISDVICIVIEPDARSTGHLYNFFEGLKADTDRVPLDPRKCILVVNKYATSSNPYMNYTPAHPQLKFERIAESTRSYFAYAVPLPLTEYCSTGNILFGTDPQIKYAAGELTDVILEAIDANELARERAAKKRGRKRRR